MRAIFVRDVIFLPHLCNTPRLPVSAWGASSLCDHFHWLRSPRSQVDFIESLGLLRVVDMLREVGVCVCVRDCVSMLLPVETNDKAAIMLLCVSGAAC